MSIELNVADWDAEEYDACCTITVAELKINGIKIPLCMNCVEELKEQVDAFCKPQYCYQCQHFTPSEYGFKYDGTCDVAKNKDKSSMEHCASFLEMESNKYHDS